MSIPISSPASAATCWAELDADDKRATLLRAAGEV
ncbi:MAG: hypothetical protein JWO23_2236, partial [Solirubrobacterales bacterium]|nr:hypothetical protein [Solirubrobacterales bacterium]